MTKPTALQFRPSTSEWTETRAGSVANPDASSAVKCPACGRGFSLEACFCPYDGQALVGADAGSADPLIGMLIDHRYQVTAKLGEGGMGVVYRVRHQILQREFALKVLRADVAGEDDVRERFLREAQLSAAINHPNVCEITDFGELAGQRPYFVMELLPGSSLRGWITKGGALPVARAVSITEQVALALEAAHQAGIVHRDLKPDNILVGNILGAGASSDERVKVVDFGFAQAAGQTRLTQPGVAFGTPHYMSPEQACGATVDHRADIYALGIVLYEMLTGQVPFEADTVMGVLSKHMYVEPEPPSRVVDANEIGALEDLVLRCLKKKPEERYQTMAELIAGLRRVVCIDGGRVSIAPGQRYALPLGLADALEPPERVELDAALFRRHSRKSQWVWASIGVAVLAGLVFIGFSSEAPVTASARSSPDDRSPDDKAKPGASVAVTEPLPVATSLPVTGPLPVTEPLVPSGNRVEAPAAGPQDAPKGAALPQTPAATTKPARKPPVSPGVHPDARPAARAARSTLDSATSTQLPAPQPTARQFGASEIIDPWSQ